MGSNNLLLDDHRISGVFFPTETGRLTSNHRGILIEDIGIISNGLTQVCLLVIIIAMQIGVVKVRLQAPVI